MNFPPHAPPPDNFSSTTMYMMRTINRVSIPQANRQNLSFFVDYSTPLP